MLSQDKMVARKYFEKLYDSECDIIEYQEAEQDNKATGFEEVTVVEKQPCRLSYESIKPTIPTDNESTMSISVKLFISPDIEIKEGSKITVSNDKGKTAFKSSGMPAKYDTHQEIMLESYEEYA